MFHKTPKCYECARHLFWTPLEASILFFLYKETTYFITKTLLRNSVRGHQVRKALSSQRKNYLKFLCLWRSPVFTEYDKLWKTTFFTLFNNGFSYFNLFKIQKKKERKKRKRLVLLSSTRIFANEEILPLFNVNQSQEEAKVNQKNHHYN